MNEAKIPIYEDGNYKNIYPKTRFQRKGKVIQKGADGKPVVKNQGLAPDEFIIVEKLYADGHTVEMPTYTFYNCKVKYEGEEVSFTLYENEHKEYKDVGGVGDRVKILLTMGSYIDSKTGMEVPKPELHFSLAE